MEAVGNLGGSLPIAATEVAKYWDQLYIALFVVCVVFTVIVVAPMVYFAIRYRARPGVKPDPIAHNTPLEIAWTAIPTVLVLAIFAWGWIVYEKMVTVPRDALEIRVVAQSWAWNFQYPDGRTTVNQMFVPAGKPIKLTITSKKADVLHSFYVPNFRIKKDAVPGMFTYAWFETEKVGRHIVFCTEYCGADHSNMLAQVIVLSPEEYQRWEWGAEVSLPPFIGIGRSQDLQKAAELKRSVDTQLALAPSSHQGLAEEGERLVKTMGCVACHSNDGSVKIGPSYKGLFNREVVLSDGSKIVADDNYVRESITNPNAKMVKGFETLIMPSYEGQLNDLQMNAVIAYLKTLN